MNTTGQSSSRHSTFAVGQTDHRSLEVDNGSSQTGAPQGEELGLMNPLSASSYNWVDNSCISDGASLYGDHATNAALGTKSI
ncbi:hypothetical protein Tco_0679064 [Tanacetum coccineum]|uniref:Uncharacterized protein n=1 Tax=Tanacetum coccineum TaxID=301880 RepID=A0ABQ4XGT1_9ASTR